MRNVLGKSIVLLAVAFIVCVPAPSWPQNSERPKALVVFGDSLVDTGNVWIGTKLLGFTPPIPPSKTPHKTYFNRRFSNGPIVVEYLCKQLGICAEASITPFMHDPRIPTTGAISLAFGGTGSGFLTETPGAFLAPGLKGQVELFRLALNGTPARADALYVIFTGANDYPIEPGRVTLDPGVVVGNIVDSVRTLYRLGARNVMVINLPNPQISPSFTLNLIPDEQKQGLVDLTTAHNELLAAALSHLDLDFKKLRIIAVDINHAIQTVILPQFTVAPPATFFFPPLDPSVPVFICLFANPASCPDVPDFNGNGYLFWDVAHPTTEAHAKFAEYLYEQIVNQP